MSRTLRISATFGDNPFLRSILGNLVLGSELLDDMGSRMKSPI
jgi:hypothetical protein